jgi:serine/threonine-protein kinase
MKPERVRYEALLESIADGVEVDWETLDSSATSDQERRRYRNLRLVARVAELHRSMVIDDGAAADVDAAPESPAAAPTEWGHLAVGERIAGGAFGDVYRARDLQLNRDVALKLLRADVSSRQPVDRLLAEARTLARVRHPNVVTVHGADVRDGRAGLWMEFVHGRTLEASLQSHGTFGAGEAATLGVDLCRALAAVHAAGLVHGDVKAQNVMREEGGRVVLMDFGAGRAQGGAPIALVGTPLYLAPEVLAGEPGTPRSDVYSLGVVLFHLLTAAYPCSAEDLDGLRTAHADGARVWLRDLRPDLPDALVRAIERALDADPARRFETAGAMERALASAMHPAAKRSAYPFWVLALALTLAAASSMVGLPRPRAVPAVHLQSIAVLPFVASDGGAADRHLTAGLTTDVVREMQRFDVEVKRAATDGGAAEPGALESRLGADGIVRGELRRTGSRTVVHVAVVRAGGAQFWSREYPVLDAGLPAIARAIAADLAAAIGTSPRAGAPAPPRQTNYAAYDAYQRGRALWEQRTPASLMRSLDYFKLASTLDPSYAEPWAGMADAYIALGVPAFGPLPPLEARRLAKEAALNALERDHDLAEAHTSLAFAAYFQDWDWTAAEVRFKKAISLNPQYALAHHWYADYLLAMGRYDEAMREIRRAQQLEPLSLPVHRDIAWHLFFQRRYDEAIAQLEETLRMDPAYAPAHTLMARALAEQGRYAEAIEHVRRAEPSLPAKTYLSFLAYVQALSGDRPAAERSLREIDAVQGYVPPYYLALVYTALGQGDRAIRELQRGVREQDATVVNLKTDPRFDPIRGAPGFQDVLKTLRFP